ncbi:MAG: UDP-N-acetylmuramoyl-tripeptide--D-alanyl-D-alanine ligase [bacterium]|nr:UDP-N-acetylmuramoyl-tripeptide--D-alanyl-D-alanine ligase [bacterium]
MKKILKPIIIFSLAFLARSILHRYSPKIVMVSGSVGKTSTKDAIAAVLSTKFYVRKSEKSFNSEFGVPFTILGVGNPWNDPFAWLGVIRSAFALLVLPNHYPNMLVLEVGADRPGDLARILRFATPDAVVITRLPEISVHVEAYASPESVREEEFSPAYALAAGAPLIISADDPYAVDNARRTPSRTTSYGLAESANVRVSDIGFYKAGDTVSGMQANIRMGSEHGAYIVRGSVGETQLFPVAAAIATAHAFGISLNDALDALKNYKTPAGRGRLFIGKNSSIIIDDSYNASPVAVEEALATLKAFPNAKRRIAVLGDMLELGRYSVAEHERIAILAGESANVIITVGIRARGFATIPKSAEILQFDNSRTAATALAAFVSEGDVVLVKGSQSIRTERIVEALLADPHDVAKLVRQEKKWLERV